jgi:hypothetical protein
VVLISQSRNVCRVANVVTSAQSAEVLVAWSCAVHVMLMLTSCCAADIVLLQFYGLTCSAGVLAGECWHWRDSSTSSSTTDSTTEQSSAGNKGSVILHLNEVTVLSAICYIVRMCAAVVDQLTALLQDTI